MKIKGNGKVQRSTKLMATGVASMLGVALTIAGVTTVAGAFTAADAPGQVLQVSGVGPASAQASADVTTKGPSGPTTATATTSPSPAPTTSTRATVRQVGRPDPQMLPGYHDDMQSGDTHHSWTGMDGRWHMKR